MVYGFRKLFSINNKYMLRLVEKNGFCKEKNLLYFYNMLRVCVCAHVHACVYISANINKSIINLVEYIITHHYKSYRYY